VQALPKSRVKANPGDLENAQGRASLRHPVQCFSLMKREPCRQNPRAPRVWNWAARAVVVVLVPLEILRVALAAAVLGTAFVVPILLVPPAPAEAASEPAIALTVTAGGLTWHVQAGTDNDEMLTASCTSKTFCLAGDDGGYVVGYDGSSWSKAHQNLSNGELVSVSCVPGGFCAAVDNLGNSYTYDGQRWARTDIDTGGASLVAVSCASSQFCDALDNRGNVFSYQVGKWGPIHFVDPNWHAVSISCPTAKFCMLIDDLGHDATWDGHSWSRPISFDLRDDPSALSCPKAETCFVADARGDVVPYRAGRWGAPERVDKAAVTALSCPSAGNCVAGDRTGYIVSSKAGNWTAPGTTGNGGARVTAISCTRALFCAAVDAAGDALVGNPAQLAPVRTEPRGAVPENTFVVSGVLNGSWKIDVGNTCAALSAGEVEIRLQGSTGTQGRGNAEFVLGWPGAGRPGYPHAQVQFPSGSGTQADLTAGVYGWTAGSTGSGTVVLSGKSGSLNLEMTPYPHTATPSPEHVQGRWQCP